jgi:hypothetical protein
MPPQGECTALAIEDAILFAQVLVKFPEKYLTDAFESYKTRTPRLETSYKGGVFRWGCQTDNSWMRSKLEEWFTSLYLWWNANAIQTSYTCDIRNKPFIE